MDVKSFVKLSKTVRAFQLPNPIDLDELEGTGFFEGNYEILFDPQAGDLPFLFTPEDALKVESGDWIIQGANGEVYPCKDEIFKKTYAAVGTLPDNEEVAHLKGVVGDFEKAFAEVEEDNNKLHLEMAAQKHTITALQMQLDSARSAVKCEAGKVEGLQLAVQTLTNALINHIC